VQKKRTNHTTMFRSHAATPRQYTHLTKKDWAWPINLLNGCSEANCQLNSNDADLTNTIRHHSILSIVNFGHRHRLKIR